VTAGIIDPTKVVRVALQDAASIAGLLITTEGMVADRPEPKGQPSMPPGGGMGDMDDVRFELLDTAMDAALDLLVGEQCEPAFDLIKPGGAGRREMHVIARVAGEPGLVGRRLVSGVIVEHQMDVKIGRHGLLDLGEEVAEFDRAMTLVSSGR